MSKLKWTNKRAPYGDKETREWRCGVLGVVICNCLSISKWDWLTREYHLTTFAIHHYRCSYLESQVVWESLEEVKLLCEAKIEREARAVLEQLGVMIPKVHNAGANAGETLRVWEKIRHMARIELKISDVRRLMGGEASMQRKYTEIMSRLCRQGKLIRRYIGVYEVNPDAMEKDHE